MRRIATCILALATVAQAASFDCKLAKSPREKAICADPRLSAADSALAAQFAALRAKLAPSGFAAVQQDQRAWLSYLDVVCNAPNPNGKLDIAACLQQHYTGGPGDIEGREQELRTTTRGPAQLYTRALYVTVPDTDAPSTRGPGDPGFGDFAFRWPQANAATGALAAFNTAANAFILKVARSNGYDQAPTLRAATGGGQSVDISYTITGANSHYILAAFTDFFDGHGAHPDTSWFSFNYSLDLNRELHPGDVFATGWQDHLTQIALAKLKQQKIDIWDGAEGPNGVHDGVTNPDQWTLDNQALTVNFAQYQINCYACGGGKLSFSWQDLEPLLNPAFHPELLPPPSATKKSRP
jgi:uncharacterized protein YecT (DUF1311 family)